MLSGDPCQALSCFSLKRDFGISVTEFCISLIRPCQSLFTFISDFPERNIMYHTNQHQVNCISNDHSHFQHHDRKCIDKLPDGNNIFCGFLLRVKRAFVQPFESVPAKDEGVFTSHPPGCQSLFTLLLEFCEISSYLLA